MFLSSSQYFAFFSLKTLCKSKKGQIRDQQLTMNPNMCVKTKNETCGNFELLAPYYPYKKYKTSYRFFNNSKTMIDRELRFLLMERGLFSQAKTGVEKVSKIGFSADL